MSLLLVLAAIVLVLWAALVEIEWITHGNEVFLALLGVACFFASTLPWNDYVARVRRRS